MIAWLRARWADVVLLLEAVWLFARAPEDVQERELAALKERAQASRRQRRDDGKG